MHEIFAAGTFNTRGIGSASAPWLVRSAAIDRLTPEGESTLRELGVDLVIDLREQAEQGRVMHTLPVVHIPLYRDAPPTEGTLEEVYRDLIVNRGQWIAAAVVEIANHPGVTLVQCTAGKDRAGLVVALARLAAGDLADEVIGDYTLSSQPVRAERAPIVARMITELDLEGERREATERLHLESPAEALEDALDLVDEFGGPVTYLIRHGASVDEVHRLHREYA